MTLPTAFNFIDRIKNIHDLCTSPAMGKLIYRLIISPLTKIVKAK